MYTSNLHTAFIGLAVADKEHNSDLLRVKVVDHLPNIQGDVTAMVDVMKAVVETRHGIKDRSITMCDYVNATWLAKDTNRVTAPDVVHGERLLIWQDGDSELYYWESLGLDHHLRTTEHLMVAVSNTNPDDRADKELTFDNSYILEVDTKGQKIHIQTNKNNGEPFAYDLVVDTATGYIKFMDDDSNHFLLDSENTLIEIRNKSKSYYTLNKEHIFEGCEGNRTLTVGGDNTVDIKGASTKTVGRNDYTKAAGIGKEASEVVIKAPKTTVDSALINLTGHVNMASFAAGAAVSGGSPPRGEGSGSTGLITGSLEITNSLTVPTIHNNTLNNTTINTVTINTSTIGGVTGSFSSACTAPNIK